jgi:hypothetical protein
MPPRAKPDANRTCKDIESPKSEEEEAGAPPPLLSVFMRVPLETQCPRKSAVVWVPIEEAAGRCNPYSLR